MNKILLDIYDYKIFIEDFSNECVIDKIRQDFLYFVQDIATSTDFLSEAAATNGIYIEIHKEHLFNFSGLSLGKTKLCRVKQVSLKKRLFSYYLAEDCRAGVSLIDNLKNKRCIISSNNSNLSFEIAYLLILSSAGENLESRGLMRLHASSFLFKNKSYCFWGLRRAGKSTLVLNLMQHLDLSIYSDENTLYDLNTNRILPFPVRMAVDAGTNLSLKNIAHAPAREIKRCFLDKKLLIDIPINNRALPNSLDFFYILGRRDVENKVISLRLKNYFFLFIDIVLGTGIVQMAEFLIRPTNILTLLKIFQNRLRLYFKILNFCPLLWERSSCVQKNMSYCMKYILNYTDVRRDIS